MNRPPAVHAGQIALLLLLVTGILWWGDGKSWFDRPRAFIEENMLRVRVNHTETIEEERARLSAKVVGLEQEIATLTDENNVFRRQLQAPLSPEMSFIPGYVISLEKTSDDTIMRIAAGSDHGVSEGMPVVSESVIIGKVISVTPRIAHVRVVASPGSKIAVKTDKKARGLLVGIQEGDVSRAVLDRVLQNEPLAANDLLKTSGEDGLPVDLIVGTVDHIISESREPFQRADVVLSLDPREVRRVFVISK